MTRYLLVVQLWFFAGSDNATDGVDGKLVYDALSWRTDFGSAYLILRGCSSSSAIGHGQLVAVERPQPACPRRFVASGPFAPRWPALIGLSGKQIVHVRLRVELAQGRRGCTCFSVSPFSNRLVKS